MTRYARKLQSRCQDRLAEGESYLWGLRAKPPWNVKAAFAGAMAGASAGAIGGSSDIPVAVGRLPDTGKAAEEEKAAACGFPYPGSMAVALTDRRLLIYARSILFGYLKDFAGDFLLERIESVKMFNEKGMGDRFLIKLEEGDPIRIYGVRRDGTKDFLELLREAIKVG